MNPTNPSAPAPTPSRDNDDQYSLEARHARESVWARDRGLVFVRNDRPEKILGQRKWFPAESWMDHPYLWRPASPDMTLSRGLRCRPTLFTCAPYHLDDDQRAEIAKFCAGQGFEFKIFEDEAAIAVGFYGFGTLHVEIRRSLGGLA